MQDDSDTPQDFDYEVRYAIIGASAAGKTAFRMRCTDGIFIDTYVPTVGVDESQRVCKFDDGRVVMLLRLIDGAASGSATWISALKRSDGLCLVFDFAQRSTFDQLDEILQGARTLVGEDIHIVLVGTRHEDGAPRTVTQSEIDNFAAEVGALGFVAVDCKTGAGIEEAVALMAKSRGSPRNKQLAAKVREATMGDEETKDSLDQVRPAMQIGERKLSFLASSPLLEIVQPHDEVTQRRMALHRVHMSEIGKDLEDETNLRKFTMMLDNGIQVVKYHRGRHGQPASRFLWLDSENQRLCVGMFGHQKPTRNVKSIALTDVAEIRFGAESFAFMASSHAPPASHDQCCISIIGTARTFDLSLYPEGPTCMLAKVLKVLVDRAINDDVKRERGKLSLQRGLTVPRRTGPLTMVDLANFEYFKDVLVKGLTVLHHTKRIVAMEKVLWLDPGAARLNLSRFKTMAFGLPDGLYLVDISEVRPGRHAHVFQNEVYPRRTVTENMCLSIIGSETTLCLSFVTPRARDLFMHKLQALLRVLRPDIITY